jgi:hypothetical protein
MAAPCVRPPDEQRLPALPRQPDGPVSLRLAALLDSIVDLPGVQGRELFDVPGFGWGYVTYRLAGGASLNASMQRLARPVPREPMMVKVITEWPTGSEVALMTRNPSVFHQIILVRPGGAILNVTASGMPGSKTPPPCTFAELVPWQATFVSLAA